MRFSRKTITLSTDKGSGEVALLDFGDPSRPPDVIFSHGNGFNAMTHRAALEPLADRLRIIAIDQRGHGRTRLAADPEGRDDWWELVADLCAVVEALKLPRPVTLAGHSMGAAISVLATARLGDRVSRLALFDPVIPERAPSPGAPTPDGLVALADLTRRRRTHFASRGDALTAYRGRGVFRTWPDEVLADYLQDGLTLKGEGFVLSCDPAWEASNYLAWRQPTRDALLSLDLPIALLRAPDAETTCRIDPDEPAVLAKPNLAIEVIEGTSHLLPVERPDLVQRALLKAARG